jgi:hypothetical protein
LSLFHPYYKRYKRSFKAEVEIQKPKTAGRIHGHGYHRFWINLPLRQACAGQNFLPGSLFRSGQATLPGHRAERLAVCIDAQNLNNNYNNNGLSSII